MINVEQTGETIERTVHVRIDDPAAVHVGNHGMSTVNGGGKRYLVTGVTLTYRGDGDGNYEFRRADLAGFAIKANGEPGRTAVRGWVTDDMLDDAPSWIGEVADRFDGSRR